MKRLIGTVAVAIALTLSLTISAQAKPPSTVQWVCVVPGTPPEPPETVIFVTAAEAARHGIETANAHAGQVFFDQFGEECTVV